MERLPARPDPERFVRLVVAGGLALVAGLWVTVLSPQASPGWLAGAGLAALGLAMLANGIASQLEPRP